MDLSLLVVVKAPLALAVWLNLLIEPSQLVSLFS